MLSPPNTLRRKPHALVDEKVTKEAPQEPTLFSPIHRRQTTRPKVVSPILPGDEDDTNKPSPYTNSSSSPCRSPVDFSVDLKPSSNDKDSFSWVPGGHLKVRAPPCSSSKPSVVHNILEQEVASALLWMSGASSNPTIHSIEEEEPSSDGKAMNDDDSKIDDEAGIEVAKISSPAPPRTFKRTRRPMPTRMALLTASEKSKASITKATTTVVSQPTSVKTKTAKVASKSKPTKSVKLSKLKHRRKLPIIKKRQVRPSTKSKRDTLIYDIPTTSSVKKASASAGKKVLRPTRLSVPEDGDQVNSLHCFVRAELLEVFTASPSECKGDKLVSKIGLRCVYCVNVPREDRVGSCMAKFYPKSLKDLYRSVCTWQRLHFKTCQFIPKDVEDKYWKLKDEDRTRGRKIHWIKSAQQLGMRDISKNRQGLMWKDDSSVKKRKAKR